MKRAIFLVVVLLMVVTALPASAGNGAPNGPHYTLNIHGVSNPKTATMDNADGHSIFVPEYGSAKIWLTSSGMTDIFQVTDANGFDNNGAAFTLPLPGECYGDEVVDPVTGEVDFVTPGTCTIRYTVWIRLLGKPNGSMSMGTCTPDLTTPDPDDAICSDPQWWVELTRSKGKSTFTNVSKELLFLSTDVDGDGNVEHVQLFDDLFDEYFWQYENQGVKLAQLRFYMGDYCVDWSDGPTGSVEPGKCPTAP